MARKAPVKVIVTEFVSGHRLTPVELSKQSTERQMAQVVGRSLGCWAPAGELPNAYRRYNARRIWTFEDSSFRLVRRA